MRVLNVVVLELLRQRAVARRVGVQEEEAGEVLVARRLRRVLNNRLALVVVLPAPSRRVDLLLPKYPLEMFVEYLRVVAGCPPLALITSTWAL